MYTYCRMWVLSSVILCYFTFTCDALTRIMKTYNHLRLGAVGGRTSFLSIPAPLRHERGNHNSLSLWMSSRQSGSLAGNRFRNSEIRKIVSRGTREVRNTFDLDSLCLCGLIPYTVGAVDSKLTEKTFEQTLFDTNPSFVDHTLKHPFETNALEPPT